jgi:two-component system, OmpR family, sensor histidine kinase CreC
LAEIAAATATQGRVQDGLFRTAFRRVATRPFTAQIYGLNKTRVDFRVYITDVRGIVLFDSDQGRDEGKDYVQWRDVHLTLKGQYGARSTREQPGDPNTSVLYVAAPIVAHGETIGVLSVGKPTTNVNVFIAQAQRKIYRSGLISGLLILMVGLLVSEMVTRPIRGLTDYATAIRDGKRVVLPPLGSSEVATLGNAFEEMRVTLEGKQYIEHYVQTLTHEIKSPVSAIHGAAELLKEEMPPERRERFLENIRVEAQRIATIVEKMLLLSSLENRHGLQEVELVNVREVVQEIAESMQPVMESKAIDLTVSGEETATVAGEPFLIRQALLNVLQNAVEFTPRSGKVWTSIQMHDGGVAVLVKDSGPGIPAYAAERIFERFYSLQRPDTGKKSSGLGLSVVKEIMQLHGGDVTVQNAPEGGVAARLVFPHRSA